MTTTGYFLLPSGALRKVEAEGRHPVEPPEGATVLTAEQYETRLAEMERAEAERIAAEAEAVRAAARADYEALVASGIPEATARRLSGYTPDPDPGPDPEHPEIELSR